MTIHGTYDDLSPKAKALMEEYNDKTFSLYPERPDLSPPTYTRRIRWNQGLLWLMSAGLNQMKKSDILILLGAVQEAYRNLTLEEMKHAGLAAILPECLPDSKSPTSLAPPSAPTTSETLPSSPPSNSPTFHQSQSTSWG